MHWMSEYILLINEGYDRLSLELKMFNYEILELFNLYTYFK